MRVDIAQFLKEPLGTQADIELSLGFCCLDDDLAVDAVQGRLRLVRTAEGVWATGVLSIDVDLECARCLFPASETIEVELDERFHLPHVHVPEGEQVYPIDAEHHVDLKPVLRELVIVSMPMQTLCRRDCLGLCPECGRNLNEGPCDCQPDEIDPRLAVLKALMDDGAES
ncbi:MAG: DUF177 domain-containing protein [Anaerolineae bacterium]|nr:DUF177 domain-containing protein [Anaerolineae bacterium]